MHLFLTGIVQVARQPTYTMIAALIKGSATEFQNSLALEDPLYTCVHKRLSPTAKKSQQASLYRPLTHNITLMYSFRERNFTKMVDVTVSKITF